ncbi:MAG: PEP-CTERM sorting domain-containing protein [Pseudomonadota bacterium]|nr:PEP-CTERM sorting domain-containing protein [Pseudomonadota bacterium]
METRRQKTLFAVAAAVTVAGALVSGDAFAGAVLYTYKGALALSTAPGTGSISGGATVGTAPPELSVLTFQMTAILEANRAYSLGGASSWTISDGVHSFSSSAPPPNLSQVFLFATDSVGAITEWDIYISTYNDATCDSSCAYWLQDDIHLRTMNSPQPVPGTLTAFDQSLLYSAVDGDFGRPWDYNALSPAAPGNWMMTPIQGGDVPEPSTITLVSAALLGVVVMRRRKPAVPTT